MNARPWLAMALLAGLAVNTAAGVTSIMAFRHRHAGELALSTAELDSALSHLTSARRWQRGDAPTCVLIGRVIQQAQANGLPLEALEGHHQAGTFAVGLAATTHGIAMNPADAWGWFNFVDVYQGFKSARVRLEAMMKAGQSALSGGHAARPDRGTSHFTYEDRVSVAAILEAIELEPDFHFYRDYLAKLYWERGMKEEAAREIRMSLSQWPRVETHPALESNALMKDLAGPILEGVDAAARSPFVGPVMAERAKATILERLGRKEEAIAAYQKTREIGDRAIAGDCDLNTGKLLIELGRFKESLPVLERGLAESGDKGVAAWTLYSLGQAYAGLGDHARATEFYRRHLEEAPLSLSGYLALADEEELAGRSAEAERLYVAAVMHFPSEPFTYTKVIEHLRKHGKAKQALSYAEGLRKISIDTEEADELIRQLEAEAAATKTP